MVIYIKNSKNENNKLAKMLSALQINISGNNRYILKIVKIFIKIVITIINNINTSICRPQGPGRLY